MKNPFIDGYIFGPHDLSGSYGMFGDVFSDEMTNIISGAIEKLHSAGKYVGIASGSYKVDVLKHWSSFSPDMLSGGADFDFIRDGAIANLKNLRNING